MANKNKIKLIRNKEGLDAPRYSVTYKANLRNGISYTILSALIQNRDVVMTMSTDLMFGMEGKEQRSFEEFVQRIKDKGLEYTSRTVPSNKQFSVFGLVLSKVKKKKEDAREIAVYVPNAVWRQADFGAILPTGGVQYYATDAPMDGAEIVRTILDMPEEEKAQAFAMNMYDISALGQTGINARDMGEEELTRALDSIR